jgi:hypothetical protein
MQMNLHETLLKSSPRALAAFRGVSCKSGKMYRPVGKEALKFKRE